QSIPGPNILANYAAPNSVIAPSLGRNLAACGTRVPCTATATIPLVAPGTLYGDRLNQVDVRVSKRGKVGRSRGGGQFDLYNLINATRVLALNIPLGPAGRRPPVILRGRLFKLGAQIDF